MTFELGTNMAARLLDMIGPAIVRGEYSDGGFPTEADATSMFGASRTVIREAVKSLISKGLLESRTRVGTRVQPTDRWNILDPDVIRWMIDSPDPTAFLMEFATFRKGVIPPAAGLAARFASPSDMDSMESAFMKLKQASDQDSAASALYLFHEAVVEASGNPVHRRMHQTMAVVIRRLARASAEAGAIYPGHYAHVLNSIRVRDVIRAEDAMRVALEEESNRLQAATETRPKARPVGSNAV